MYSRLIRTTVAGLALLFAGVVFACSGGNSTNGADTRLKAQTFNEKCALCHRSGSIADIAVVHNKESNSPDGRITGVEINGDTGKVVIRFKLFESANALVPLAGVAANNIRFTLSKLVPGDDGGWNWQSYINTTEVKEAGEPGSAPDGARAIQATAERANAAGGVFSDHADGAYAYTMSIDINAVTTPLAVAYEPTRTHRVAMQVSDNVGNAIYNFTPNGDPVSQTRDISDNSSCNECHIKLGFHGGDRIRTDYCVTCHNPGSADANSGHTVDFKVMIHKIHAGENNPEVQGGGEYAIWGFGNSKHDYSTVVLPQDTRNCDKCHNGADAATPDGDNWKLAPSAAACTSCHHAPDAVRYPTFPYLTATQIEAAHQIAAQSAATTFKYNIIGIMNTRPGDKPSITFSVTDPTRADIPYDIINDAPFTAAGGASRLAVLIGWETTDYTNTGGGGAPAQPVSINPLAPGAAVVSGGGAYTVTSPIPLPANATGSGVVAIEGHPAADFDGDGIYSDRVPVTSAVRAFAITHSAAVSRRQVVDINNCNQCHALLSLHGNNRTNNPQVCVICHNADATDISVRPAASNAVDGKVEQAIDFKYMVHAIHAGDSEEHGFRENGLVVYGFRGSINDFSDVRLPSGTDNLRNCAGCHSGPTYAVPLSESVLPTTVLTGGDLSSPDDDTNNTPVAAVCSSCHDLLSAKTHMAEEGALFDFVPFIEEREDANSRQGDLCAPGPLSAQPPGHSERTDCCGCHSP